MKLLLDTHIWLWMVLDPTRLSRRVANILDDPANQLWLSPISVWELLMLTQKQRIELDENAVLWARRTMEQLQLHEAPLTMEVALETSTLDIAHSDPADRLIAASAKTFGLTLVTADEKLMSTRGIKILANK